MAYSGDSTVVPVIHAVKDHGVLTQHLAVAKSVRLARAYVPVQFDTWETESRRIDYLWGAVCSAADVDTLKLNSSSSLHRVQGHISRTR